MFRFLRRRSFWTIVLTALALLAIMKFSSSNRQEITGLERLVQGSFAPVQSGLDWVKQGFNQVRFYLLGGNDLEEQLVALQTENDRLRLENMQLREDSNEVVRLRSLLSYIEPQTDQYELATARVIARSANNWYKTLTIDKGSNSGIVTNMPVITPLGLVGKVVSVGRNSSQVWLITDREMAVGAILQNTRETKGIVEGMGDNGSLRMINIPYYSKVALEERVITSGLSENYPPGIEIGTIKDIKKEANGLVLSATVQPAVDFNQLEEVLVLKKFRGADEVGGEGV